MDQKDRFDDEEGKFEGASEGDELGGLRGELNAPKKGKAKLFLLIGLLLVAGAYAGNFFLSRQEEPGAPTVPFKRIPIKGAPVLGVVKGINAVPAQPKEVAKAEKPEKKMEKQAPKGAAKAEIKKGEVKPEGKKPEEVKVAKKKETPKPKQEVKAEKKVKYAETTVIIGTYAARYDLEAGQERLKGAGIRYLSRETKKKLVMNRVFVKEARDKEEVKGLISALKEKGYEPFSVLAGGVYKVYAVSNLSEEIANENKADLEKLGYEPVIEKKAVDTRVYELIARAKSAEDAKAMYARLKK